METKYLWDIIDKLRDELSIAQDGITDLNDVLKDMQEESIEQIEDNKKLKAELERKDTLFKDYSKGAKEHHERGEEYERELKAEIKQLRAELDKVRRCNKTMDGIIIERDAEIEDLRKACKLLKADVKEKENQYHMLASSKTSHYPKELTSEADEYFEHNPQAEKVYFMLITNDDCDEDGDINGCLNIGDAIAEYDNYNGKIERLV